MVGSRGLEKWGGGKKKDEGGRVKGCGGETGKGRDAGGGGEGRVRGGKRRGRGWVRGWGNEKMGNYVRGVGRGVDVGEGGGKRRWGWMGTKGIGDGEGGEGEWRGGVGERGY